MEKKIVLILTLALCVSLLSGCAYLIKLKPTAAPSIGPSATATSEPVPTEPAEYMVPNVLGRTVEELETYKTILGDFRLEVVDTVFSENFKEGTICEQSPEAGSLVRGGELVITVKISGGAGKVRMRDVWNEDAREALRLLQDEMGLAVDVQYEYSDTIPQDYVIRYLPMEGTLLERGDIVTIWVSRGPEVTATEPPVGPGALKGFTTNTPGKDSTFKDKQDGFTLREGESWQMRLTFDPADWSGEVTYSISDTRYATVSADGLVTNVNPDSSLHGVILTISAGGLTLEMRVYCRGVSATDPPASDPPATQPPSSTVAVGKQGTVVNTPNGVYIRSGPGTSYERIASLFSGDPVTVLEDAGDGWYKISFAGVGGATEGYIKGDYISTD